MSGFSFVLNKREVRVPEGHHNTTLLNFVRQHATATKEGCAEGDCGACTVAVLEGGAFKAINSCLVLLPSVAGLEVWTADGIGSSSQLHPVQTAMASAGGSQCGYCTPGFVMSLFAEYHREARVEFQEDCLTGNLCRCTGYRPIREAGASLELPAKDDAFEQRKSVKHEQLRLEYAGFHRPISLKEALELRAAHPEARLIAGGTDVALEITTAFKALPQLISLEAVPELLQWREVGGWLEIGASVTFSKIETDLSDQLPLLGELMPWFASRQIRNRATLGGNLGTASPIGDAPVVLLALAAELVLISVRGQRTVPLKDYFVGYRQTLLEPDEIIQTIRVPLQLQPALRRLYKIAKRGYDDISSVMAAFHCELNNGLIETVRLAYGGVAAIPTRAYNTEAELIGQPWTRATLERAKSALSLEFKPISDARASAAYRQKIIVNLLEKFWLDTVVETELASPSRSQSGLGVRS
jgi:xanthine dehydrogenase small subunit